MTGFMLAMGLIGHPRRNGSGPSVVGKNLEKRPDKGS